jgi:hypothetical protein
MRDGAEDGKSLVSVGLGRLVDHACHRVADARSTGTCTPKEDVEALARATSLHCP